MLKTYRQNKSLEKYFQIYSLLKNLVAEQGGFLHFKEKKRLLTIDSFKFYFIIQISNVEPLKHLSKWDVFFHSNRIKWTMLSCDF